MDLIVRPEFPESTIVFLAWARHGGHPLVRVSRECADTPTTLHEESRRESALCSKPYESLGTRYATPPESLVE